MEVDVKKPKNKKINAPFGYFGSKNKIALQICKQLPPHNCWVEAFCGSAAVTLSKKQAPIEIINDIDNEIVNFFEQLRDHSEELCRLVALTPYARQELINARTCVGESKLERARTFLVSSMMAVNGLFGEDKGGFSCSQSFTRNGKEARVSRWYNLPDRLQAVVERLRDTRIENKNAIELVETFLYRPATLIYLDPPYFADRVNGYNKDANDEQFHKELLKVVNKAKCMVIVSGYKNDLYDSLLTTGKGWKIKTINTITKDPSGNSHDRTEVIWMNKYFTYAAENNKIPIRLTKNEIKEKKVNPERKSFKL